MGIGIEEAERERWFERLIGAIASGVDSGCTIAYNRARRNGDRRRTRTSV